MVKLRNLKIRMSILFVCCTFLSFSKAQAELGGREKISIVMYSTIGGAILGLSTLSFYSKSAEHTGNIYTGAGLGLLGGLSYVGYKSFSSGSSPQVSPSYDFGLLPTNNGQIAAYFLQQF